MYKLENIKLLLSLFQDNPSLTSKELRDKIIDSKVLPNRINLNDIREIQHIANMKDDNLDSLFEELKSASGIHRVSKYGLDMNVYRAILLHTKISGLFLDDIGTEVEAYKLSVMFGDEKSATEYLNKYFNQNPTNQALHNACLFNMPENDKWHIPTWRILSKKYMNNVRFKSSFAIPKASEIEKKYNSIKDKSEQDHNSNIDRKIILEGEINKLKENEICIQSAQLYKYRRNISKAIKKLEAKCKSAPQLIQSATLAELQEENNNLTKINQEILMLEQNHEAINLLRNKRQELRQIITAIKAHNPLPKLRDIQLNELLALSLGVRYKRAFEAPVAAEIFSKCNTKGVYISEDVFNTYLDDIHGKTQSSDLLLPPVLIKGDEVGLPGYFLCKMTYDDPRGAVLGFLTGCCQSLGNYGDTCARNGMLSENAGFYLICKGQAPEGGDTKDIKSNNIVAQTWARRGTDKYNRPAILLDSFEAQNFMVDDQRLAGIEKMFYKFTYMLAQLTNVDTISVGTGPSSGTPASMGYASKNFTHSTDQVDYTDANTQRELYDTKMSLYNRMAWDTNAISEFLSLPKEEQQQFNEENLNHFIKTYASPKELTEYIKQKVGFNAEQERIVEYITKNDLFTNCRKELIKPMIAMGVKLIDYTLDEVQCPILFLQLNKEITER